MCPARNKELAWDSIAHDQNYFSDSLHYFKCFKFCSGKSKFIFKWHFQYSFHSQNKGSREGGRKECFIRFGTVNVCDTFKCQLELFLWLRPRIREHIGSVIGGRVPATQGSSGPCVYCRKPGVRSLYTYVAS